MKTKRFFAIILLLLILLVSTTSCGVLSMLDNLDEWVDSASVLDFDLENIEYDEFIYYPNAKRNQVLQTYIGDKLERTHAEALIDNIELSYSETDTAYLFEVCIENLNANYIFDGVVNLSRGNESYIIRVDMLAPRNVEYFYMTVEHDAFSEYYYYALGEFYQYVNEINIDYNYYFEWIDAEFNEIALIVDVSDITDEILEEFAEYLYLVDTFYNVYYPNTYYFFTHDQIEEEDYTFSYSIEVDTSQQVSILRDENQRVIQHFRF